MSSAFKTVRTETTADGKTVEMKHAVFGKGRNRRTESYKIFVDGVEVDYAVNAPDADENFEHAIAHGCGRKSCSHGRAY